MPGLRLNGLQPYALSLMRLAIAFTFVEHGVQKLFGALGGSRVALASQFGAAGVIEFIGGLLLLLGLFTRPVAFILCGEMAFAYFMKHAPGGFWPIQNHGELAVVYCFVFLYLAFAGGGPISLDRAVWRKK